MTIDLASILKSIAGILKFFGKMAAFVAFFLLGREKKKNEELEKDVRTHEKANEVDHAIEFDSRKRKRVREKYNGS